MFEQNDEPNFELIECRRWITSDDETQTILADQVAQIVITSKIKKNKKYYYLQCVLVLSESEKVITLARYTKKHLILKEKSRLINWLNSLDKITEFKCFPENIESMHITSKNFYNEQ